MCSNPENAKAEVNYSFYPPLLAVPMIPTGYRRFFVFLLLFFTAAFAPTEAIALTTVNAYSAKQYENAHELFFLRDPAQCNLYDQQPFAATTLHNSVRVFFSQQGLHLVHYAHDAGTLSFHNETWKDADRHTGWTVHRVDFLFVDANTAKIETIGRRESLRWVYTSGTDYSDGCAYQGLRYIGVWPGIDFECFTEDGGLKYQFVIHPGANPNLIRLSYDGVQRATLIGDGKIEYNCGNWNITDAAPIAYTLEDSSENIPVKWLQSGRQLRFQLASVPKGKTIVIDPFLQWSTLLGGSFSDYAKDVAIGPDGSFYVCGYTASTDFPTTPGVMQTKLNGNFDVFVAKYSQDRQIVWTTLFGGKESEENPKIALSPLGSIVIAGSSASIDLPFGPGAAQPRNGGRYDVFLVVLDNDGRMKWGSYLGGSFSDECGGVAVDSQGRICVAGSTYSTNFPVTANAWQTSNAGDYDMFVARFTPDGALEWATYLGGWSMDIATGIAVNASGDMFISGRSESTNLPAIGNGFQPNYGGGSFDAIYYHIDGRHRKVIRGSYLGGEGEDGAETIAIRKDGSIVLAGYTSSTRFPTTDGLSLKKGSETINSFITVVSPKGDLQWSTVFGGSNVDRVTCLAVDVHDNAFLAGLTASRDFPLAGASVQKEKALGFDAFVTQFGANGSYLWGSFFGGDSHDFCHGIAVDAKGNVVTVGGSESKMMQPGGGTSHIENKGLTDGFILRLIFNEPFVGAGPDTTICAGQAVMLGGEIGGGQPPYRFNWQPSEGLNNNTTHRPIASPSRTTSYILAVTDAEGAVMRDTVIVTVVALPVAKAGTTVAMCSGNTVQLRGNASGGTPPYTFSWSPVLGRDDESNAVITVSPQQSTWYVLTVTDARGCSHSDSVLVRVHPPLNVNAGGDRKVCANSPENIQAEVSGGSPPYRYSWIPEAFVEHSTAHTTSFTVQNSTNIIVTVTDANGCTATDTVRVTAHQPPVVDAGDDKSVCAGEKVVLTSRASGGKPPYQYHWSPADGLNSAAVASPQAVPVSTTLYSLTVTDANGCKAVDSLLVAVHSLPQLSMKSEVAACGGVPVTIGNEATNGTPPYIYLWKPAAGLSDPTSAMPLASPARSSTYSVVVTDANGCKTGGSVRVTVHPRPVLHISGGATLCRGASTQLSATIRGGAAPYQYLWSPAEGLSSATIASPVASPTISTTYKLTLTDAAGCVVEEQVSVNITESPQVSIDKNIALCSGSEVELTANVSGGRPPYRFAWNPATGLNSVRTLNPRAKINQPVTYTLTVTDAAGCNATDAITIVPNPSPQLKLSSDVTTCAGSAVQLTTGVTGGTPPYKYIWTPAFGLSDAEAASPVANPTTTTLYTVTVTDAAGCTVSGQLRVTIRPLPSLSLPHELTICRGQSKRLELEVTGGSKPYRYEWTPREGLSNFSSPSPVANPVQTTTYTVTVTDAQGCKTSAVIVVTVNPCNKADAGEDQTLCSGEKVRIGTNVPDTGDGARFNWLPAIGLDDPRSASPHAAPTKTTRYILQVTNRYGCTDADTVYVSVRDLPQMSLTKDMTVCSGESAGLAVQVRGGKSPYRYSWSPQIGLSKSMEARTEARPDSTVRYTVTVTDANGCLVRDSVLVTVTDALYRSGDRALSVCEGSAKKIEGRVTGGTPPFLFFWSPAEGLDNRTSANPTVTPRRSLKYSVTVTDANGCQIVDSVSVTFLKAPVVAITASGPTDICEADELILSAPDGFARYRWSTGSETPELRVSEPGEYFVTVWNDAGCEKNSTPVNVSVYQPPKPVIRALGPLRFCEGDSVILDAGADYRYYHWSDGSKTRRISVRKEGEYSVTVAGPGACERVSATVRISLDPRPFAEIDRKGDTLIASDAVSWQWLNNGKTIIGATERLYIPTRAGKYSVRIRNSQGCTSISTVVQWRPETKKKPGALRSKKKSTSQP